MDQYRRKRLMNRIREWGETGVIGADGALSHCGEFLTPIHNTSQRHPS